MSDPSRKKRILLLTDWIVKDDDWSFLRELRALGHECETVGVSITRNYGSKLKKMFVLWSGYLLLGVKGFIKGRDFDVVVAYQGVAGLFYAFLRIFAFGTGPGVVLMAFFFKKRRNAIYNQLRYLFTRLALAGIDKVICYSSKEAAYYTELFRAKTGKFVFVRFGVNVDRLNRIFSPASQDYVFAAGSSNRDYGTFFNAIKDLDTRVVVVAKRFNLHGHLIPKNVEVLYDVYGDQYYELLKNAQLIVIPLDDPELSSGQMVLLESMGLGKAVIASEVWGVSDYVDDGRNALLVPIHDCVRMKSAIEDLLKDAVRLGEMGVSARQSVQERFSAAEMAKGVSAELAQL